MAYDKVIDSAVLDTDLASIADAIRSKGGTSASLAFPAGFVNAISAIKTGITPTGTKTITENGTHDVTNYANAQVNVKGLNAVVFTSTLASDVTSGNVKLAPANAFLASIRNNPKAFVWVRHTEGKASTAMIRMWIVANFNLIYYGSTAVNGVLIRTSTSASSVTNKMNGVAGTNDSGSHINVESDGSIMVRGAGSSYPVKAGTYEIIGGIAEML